MIVSISGPSGFIGSALRRKMNEKGWTIRRIDRQSFSLSDEEFRKTLIEGSQVVIHLAGAPLSKRWTPQYKTEIYNSRIATTQKVVKAILEAEQKPSVLLSSSAIGIYDSSHSHTESSGNLSDSFVGKLCHAWETEAMKAAGTVRVVIFRTGLVLGKNGGVLEKMYLPFSIGAGAKVGNGSQPISFIHLDDLVDAFIFAIENQEISNVVNCVSPYPTTNAEFSETLGQSLKQPVWFTVPAFAIKLIYGEGAVLLLEGQNVVPEKLMQAGFRFRYPTIRNALTRVYRA